MKAGGAGRHDLRMDYLLDWLGKPTARTSQRESSSPEGALPCTRAGSADTATQRRPVRALAAAEIRDTTIPNSRRLARNSTPLEMRASALMGMKTPASLPENATPVSYRKSTIP